MDGYTSHNANIMPMQIFKCSKTADNFAENFASGGVPWVIAAGGPRIWSYTTVFDMRYFALKELKIVG